VRRIAFSLLFAAACFNPDEPPCSFACGDNGACPDDYTCAADGYCHKNGSTGECGFSDAAMPLDMAVPVDFAGGDLSSSDAMRDLEGEDGSMTTDGAPPDLTGQCNVASDCTPGIATCNGTTFTPAPTCVSHQCVAGTAVDCSTMTTNKLCNVAAGCVQCNSGNDCAPASCNSTTFTPAATCNASHACVPGTAVDCSTMTTNKLCDPVAGCVQCNGNPDCPAASCNSATFTPASTCSAHVCSTPSSTDCSTMTTNKLCNASVGCVQCNSDPDCGTCATLTYTPGTCSSHTCTPGTPQTCPTACNPMTGCT
jgi:hypothetical protein